MAGGPPTSLIKSLVSCDLHRWSQIIGLFEDLLSYLTEQHVSLMELSRRESSAMQHRWTAVFGRFSDRVHYKHGPKAVAEWLSTADDDVILMFLSSRITAFPISTNQRPCSAFRYTGNAIDLSRFHELEFALFPECLSWTLVHTHEVGAFGGPYFIRAGDIRSLAGGGVVP